MQAPAPNYYRMTISEFRRAAFLGKAPCANTIKRAIDNRHWLGEKINGLYFIFVDANGQPIPGKAPGPSTGNEAADRIIIEWQAKQR